MIMALRALTEVKMPAVRCRLTPPSSPSRKFGAQAAPYRTAYKSRVLAALDAEFDASGNIRRPSPSTIGSIDTLPSRPSASSRTFTTVAKYSDHVFSDAEIMEILASKESLPPDVCDGPDPFTVLETLPSYSYKDFGTPAPAVVYTRDESEANDLVECLQQPLGFDMEWRVFYSRRQEGKTVMLERPTAVVQLCDPKMILVMQISAMKNFPQKLKEVLENDIVWKCGVNIRNDAMKLYRDFGVLPRCFAELGGMAHEADRTFKDVYKRSIVSLQKMVARYLERNVEKPPIRTGNWEAQPLTREQIEYAANDAHAALMVFRELRKVAVKQKRKVNNQKPLYTIDLRKEFEAGTLDKGKGKSKSKDKDSGALAAPPRTVTAEASSTVVAIPVRRELPPEASFEWQRRRRAYNMWYEGKLTLREMSITFNRGSAHVILYVLRALEADLSLPYDPDKLTALVNENQKARPFYRKWCTRMAIKQQQQHQQQQQAQRQS